MAGLKNGKAWAKLPGRTRSGTAKSSIVKKTLPMGNAKQVPRKGGFKKI